MIAAQNVWDIMQKHQQHSQGPLIHKPYLQNSMRISYLENRISNLLSKKKEPNRIGKFSISQVRLHEPEQVQQQEVNKGPTNLIVGHEQFRHEQFVSNQLQPYKAEKSSGGERPCNRQTIKIYKQKRNNLNIETKPCHKTRTIPDVHNGR